MKNLELAGNNHENQLKIKWSELDLHFGDWGKEYSLSLSQVVQQCLCSAVCIENIDYSEPFWLHGIEFVEIVLNVYLKMVKSEEVGLKIH